MAVGFGRSARGDPGARGVHLRLGRRRGPRRSSRAEPDGARAVARVRRRGRAVWPARSRDVSRGGHARAREDGTQGPGAVPSDSRRADGGRLRARARSGGSGHRSRRGAARRAAGASLVRSCRAAETARGWRSPALSGELRTDVMLIYGINAVSRSAEGAARVAADPRARRRAARRRARARAHELRIPIETLDRRALDKLTRGGVHQGVAADLQPLPAYTVEELVARGRRAAAARRARRHRGSAERRRDPPVG